MSENLNNTKPGIDPNEPDGGDIDIEQQFIDMLEELDEEGLLGWFDNVLGAAAAGSLPAGIFRNEVADPLHDVWGNAVDGGIKQTHVDRLKFIQSQITNDPSWDYGKWRGLLMEFRFAGPIAGAISAYEYYIAWTSIDWIRDNTKGWTAEEYISVFGDLVSDVPFALISLLHAMFSFGFEPVDEFTVYESPDDYLRPPSINVRVGGGSIVKVDQPNPRTMTLSSFFPEEYSPPEGDWIDDLREVLLPFGNELVDHGELDFDFDPIPDPEPSPVVRVEVSPVDTNLDGYRDRLAGIQITMSLGELASGPQNRPDPAEEWTRRRDIKSKNAMLYVGFIKLINKTYGEISEIRDLWEVIVKNVIIEYDGEVIYYDELSGREQLALLGAIADGDAELLIDGDGLIFDLFMMELIDRSIGKLKQSEREWLRENGIGGLFDYGNPSTWFSRIRNINERLNLINEGKSNESE
jgi:hypothetical protein